MKMYDCLIKCSTLASGHVSAFISTCYHCHLLPGKGSLQHQLVHCLGNSMWRRFGHWAPGSPKPPGPGSSSLASPHAPWGSKGSRAGEPASKKTGGTMGFKVSCRLGTCQLGYEHKEQNSGCGIYFRKQNRLLTGHRRKKLCYFAPPLLFSFDENFVHCSKRSHQDHLKSEIPEQFAVWYSEWSLMLKCVYSLHLHSILSFTKLLRLGKIRVHDVIWS